jgi:hypothetical protein
VRGEEAPVMAGQGDGTAAGRGGFRASHADRDRAIDLLKAAFVQGRLTQDELAERLGQALAARTYAELAALTADLHPDLHPGLAGAQLERKPAASRGAVGRGAAALAALLLAIAAVALATATAPGRPAAIAPVRPAAVVPDLFSPFVAYAAFGWLPAGYKLLEGGTTRGSTYQVAWRPSLATAWYLVAYPAGGCQLTKARGLLCRAYYPFGPLALTSRAPDINGHRAYWATAYAAHPPSPRVVLAWQYASGSWAVLELGNTKPLDAHGRNEAVKAASHARFGVRAAPPVAFPVRLTGVPASWHLISGVRAWMPYWNGVTYQPHGQVLSASEWSVSTTAASTGPRAGPHFLFTIGLAARHNSCRVPVQGPLVRKIVNGYPVIVARGPAGQTLCAADADGLSVTIYESGNRPTLDVVSLFADHLQLLGASPAHWATRPIR